MFQLCTLWDKYEIIIFFLLPGYLVQFEASSPGINVTTMLPPAEGAATESPAFAGY